MSSQPEQGTKRGRSKLGSLYVTIGVLLWVLALYLALRHDYQPLPSAAAGAMGAILIESGWTRRRLAA